jgi:hypothetical protein
LSSGEFAIAVATSLIDHNSVKLDDLKSVEYFKICGDLEEVAITKSVPNCISYPTNFIRFLFHFYLFPALKIDFRGILI